MSGARGSNCHAVRLSQTGRATQDHTTACPSLLKRSGSGLSSSLRLELRLIRSVLCLTRVGEPAVRVDGRFVALLCDLPKVLVLLFEFLSVANMMCVGMFPRHATALAHNRTAKHASVGFQITVWTTVRGRLCDRFLVCLNRQRDVWSPRLVARRQMMSKCCKNRD